MASVELRLSPQQREDAADKILDMLAQRSQLGQGLASSHRGDNLGSIAGTYD